MTARSAIHALNVRMADARNHDDATMEATRSQFGELRAEIKAEGETTRRHFDMMAERMASTRIEPDSLIPKRNQGIYSTRSARRNPDSK